MPAAYLAAISTYLSPSATGVFFSDYVRHPHFPSKVTLTYLLRESVA
jgi:hypothetical protein